MKPRYLWVNRAAFQLHWVSFLPEKLITLILKSSPAINGVSNFSHENMRIAVPKALIFVGGFNMIFLFGMKIPLAQTAFFSPERLKLCTSKPSAIFSYDFGAGQLM